MFCSNCGATLEDNAKFCGACGTPTQTYAPPPLAPTEAPAYTQPPPEPTEAPAYTPPPPEPVYEAPVYEAPTEAPAYTPPPPEPVYEAPAYAPPPQEPVYQAPVYDAPVYSQPSYAPPANAPSPQEPVYQAPTEAPAYVPPPPEPVYSQPAYTPHANAPSPQEQAYQAPAYTAPYGGPPPSQAGSKKGLSMAILIPIAAIGLLLALFAGLWLFTGIFTGGSSGGTVSNTDAPPTRSPSPSPETSAPSPTPTTNETPEPPRPVVEEGYYTLIAFEADGEDLMDAYAGMGLDVSSFYLEILGGRRFIIVFMGEAIEGSYTVSDDIITLTSADIETDATGIIEGDKLIIDVEGTVMTFQWDPWFVPPEPGDDYAPWLDPDLPLLFEGVNYITQPGYYRFVPSEPGSWHFRTFDSGASDPMLKVYDAIGNELGFDDDSAGDYDAFLAVDVLYTAIVEITFWDDNTYTTLEILLEGEGGTAPGMVVEGFIPTGGGIVAIREPQLLEFTMDRAGFWVFYTQNNGVDDPQLILYDQDGQEYADDDDSMGDYNALLIVYFDEGEPGFIEASFYGTGSGYYELVVKGPERLPDSGGAFTVEAPQAFVFTPDKTGTWDIVTSNNGSGNPFIQFFDEYGNVYEDNDSAGDSNAMLSLDLVAGERYHVLASFATKGPITYTLTIS